MTTDSQARKEQPIMRGVLDYFPDAIAEVARTSFIGNQKHNPGEPLHWARGKSDDHSDCIARHLIERGTLDDDGLRHSAKVAWRALALLQTEIENATKPPLGNGAVYIAGPMRGYPELNYPAFHEAAALGRGMNFKIISPAEEDMSFGVSPSQTEFSSADCRKFAERDVAIIFKCRAVAVLPGWEKSVGATAEVALARWLGLPILDARTFKALEEA
jgi:hypothetical protein